MPITQGETAWAAGEERLTFRQSYVVHDINLDKAYMHYLLFPAIFPFQLLTVLSYFPDLRN